MTNLLKTLSVSGGVEQTPTEALLATAEFWYDDTTNTFTFSGGVWRLQSWENRGTAGAHTFLINEGNDPQRQFSNGLECIRLFASGSSWRLDTGNQTITSDCTVFLVAGESRALGAAGIYVDSWAFDPHLQLGRSATTGYPFVSQSGTQLTIDEPFATDGATDVHVWRLSYNRGGVDSVFSVSGHGSVVGDLGDADINIGSIFAEERGTALHLEGLCCEYIVFESKLTYDEVMLIETYLKDKWIGPFAELTASPLLHYDETTIVGSSPVTAWNNKGTGGVDYDADNIIGTAGSLTRTTVNGLSVVESADDVRMETDDVPLLTDFTRIVVIDPIHLTAGAESGIKTFIGARDTDFMNLGINASGNWISYAGVNHDSGIQGLAGSMQMVLQQFNQDATSAIGMDGGDGYGETVGSSGSSNGDVLTLFGDSAGFRTEAAIIGEVMVFDQNFTLTEKEIIGKGLMGKWIGTAEELLATALVNFDETSLVGSAPVTEILNKGTGGSLYDLDQVAGTSGNLIATTVNGLTVVQSLGNVSIKPTINTIISGKTTEFIMVRVDDVSGAGNRVLYSTYNDLDNVHVLYFVANDASNRHNLWQGTANVSVNDVPTDTNLHLWTGQFNQDALTKLTISGIGNNTGNAGVEGFDFATFFSEYNNTAHCTMTMCQYVLFDFELTEAEINVVRNYLERKWGIA